MHTTGQRHADDKRDFYSDEFVFTEEPDLPAPVSPQGHGTRHEWATAVNRTREPNSTRPITNNMREERVVGVVKLVDPQTAKRTVEQKDGNDG